MNKYDTCKIHTSFIQEVKIGMLGLDKQRHQCQLMINLPFLSSLDPNMFVFIVVVGGVELEGGLSGRSMCS